LVLFTTKLTKAKNLNKHYEFFRNQVFREDLSYKSFPMNSVFTPDWFGNAEALMNFLLERNNYRNLLLPRKLMESFVRTMSFLSDEESWNEGELNRRMLNDILAVNPFVRFWCSLIFKSNVDGLFRTYYPNSSFLNDIKFERLYNERKPCIILNAWNLSKQQLQLFSNKNHKHKPISAASLCACSALPLLEATVEIDGDAYCEGTLIDTANFKTLLEDHPDLDEIWIIRVRDATRFLKPLNLHDAMGNLFQKFEATLAENDVKLFKYHVKHEGKWHGRIVEVQVHSDVNLEWSHSNLDIGVREGQLAASEVKPACSFFFTLEGESAHGDEALWNTTFDLVFNYAVPPKDVLAELKGKKFEALAEGDVELGIDVVPKGLTLTDGIARRIVAFKDGKMVGERPRFRLQAPSKSTGAQFNKRGIYVFFSRKRAQLYSHFFRSS
jgi:predicted acylesterase/phospholipase RssA